MGLIVLTLIFSAALYSLIEKPLRLKSKGKNLSNGSFLKAVSGFAVAVLFSTGYVLSGGELSLNQSEIAHIKNDTFGALKSRRNTLYLKDCGALKEKCDQFDREKINMVVLGDSHGVDGYNIMRTMFPDANILLTAYGGCPPLLSLEEVRHQNQDCGRLTAGLWAKIESLRQVKNVVISMRLDEQRLAGAIEVVAWLKARGFHVILMGIGPWYGGSVMKLAANKNTFAEVEFAARQKLRSEIFQLNDLYREKVESLGGVYVDKLSYFCPERRCKIFTKSQKELIVFDSHHLTIGGAVEFGEAMRQKYLYILK